MTREVREMPIFLTVDQVAEILRLRPQTVRHMLSAGQIAGVRVGGGKARLGRWRIPRKVIERMLQIN